MIENPIFIDILSIESIVLIYIIAYVEASV